MIDSAMERARELVKQKGMEEVFKTWFDDYDKLEPVTGRFAKLQAIAREMKAPFFRHCGVELFNTPELKSPAAAADSMPIDFFDDLLEMKSFEKKEDRVALDKLFIFFYLFNRFISHNVFIPCLKILRICKKYRLSSSLQPLLLKQR